VQFSFISKAHSKGGSRDDFNCNRPDHPGRGRRDRRHNRGALAFSEPEKSRKQIRDIVESRYDHGAEMIVTPCQLCQANVEVYQSEINKPMTVDYGGSPTQAGLDEHLIQPDRLQKIAERKK
jgi:hypothetical protein